LDDPLIWIRAVHLASTVMASGLAVFVLVVAEPALRSVGAPFPPSFRRQAAWNFHASLAVAAVSGVAWFWLLAARIAGAPASEVFTDDTAWVLLTETQFGWACLVRLGCAAALAATFSSGSRVAWRRTIALMSSALFLGGLAWMGHGGATPGAEGYVHLGADFLHLLAVGAWLGGLVPLLLILRCLSLAADRISAAAIYGVSQQFSDFAFVAVVVLAATGLVNSWFLVGNIQALTGSDYGRLLLLKVGLFVAMLAFATANRLVLLPRLSLRETAPDQAAIRRLQHSIVAEICLGLAVVAVVAALGIMMPAAQVASHHH